MTFRELREEINKMPEDILDMTQGNMFGYPEYKPTAQAFLAKARDPKTGRAITYLIVNGVNLGETEVSKLGL